jgi:transmembrane sensor
VSYTDNWRTVYLIKGEASFDVTKDSRRHFVVHAGSGLAEALGTSFNVRLTQDVVDVTVTKGRVWVLTNAAHAAPPDPDQNQTNPTPTQIARGTTDHVVLAAGQSAKFDNVIESVVDKIPAETLVRKLAWHDGAIVFSGETLRDALVEISRYTAKPLVIVDPSIASLRIGGRYKTDDMGALLAALSSNFGIKAVEDSQGRILLFAQQG